MFKLNLSHLIIFIGSKGLTPDLFKNNVIFSILTFSHIFRFKLLYCISMGFEGIFTTWNMSKHNLKVKKSVPEWGQWASAAFFRKKNRQPVWSQCRCFGGSGILLLHAVLCCLSQTLMEAVFIFFKGFLMQFEYSPFVSWSVEYLWRS